MASPRRWNLRANGLRVRVVERGRVMSEASWAAAGMLAAHDPEHPRALMELAALSETLYPAYLRLIEELSGQQVALRTTKALVTHAGSRVWMEEAKPRPAETYARRCRCAVLAAGSDGRRKKRRCLASPVRTSAVEVKDLAGNSYRRTLL